VACLAVLIVVLVLVIRPALSGGHANPPAADYLGAELGAPADAAHEYSAARPEWYFLFLFQFLKLFAGQGATGELLGAIVVPGAIMLVLALMPLVGRWQVGHVFNVSFLVILLAGIGVLTMRALYDDHLARYVAKPAEGASEAAIKRFEASQAYLNAVEQAKKEAQRAVELAEVPEGIPPAGMLAVLLSDPKIQGPHLFDHYCANCHTHADATETPQKQSASDLTHFTRRDWFVGLLDPDIIAGPRYFGATKHKDEPGGMVEFVRDTFKRTDDEAERKARAQKVQQIAAALSAEAKLPSQKENDKRDAKRIETGRKQIMAVGCTDCHKFHDQGDLGMAPDLTDYGSYEWLAGMIANPEHERFYKGNNDRMPAFAEHADKPEMNILSPANLDLLVRWLRSDWYEPGTPHTER
jgi:ubiquinol-cytochrome c reductase cytochrome b subunit